ncbi:MAG: hypothetical protein JST20_11285 [Bacteroidetes bacterium]|nr:hypothetical protein [Bacteroidota bacterium]
MKNKAILLWATLLFAIVLSVGESRAQAPSSTIGPLEAPVKAGDTKMRAPSSNYTWTTPTAGMPMIPVWKQGQTVNLTWTGGPTGPVKLYLINWCTWTAQLVIAGSTPNTHSYSWTVPATLPCGVYECYIQNATGTPVAWTYSLNFAVTRP